MQNPFIREEITAMEKTKGILKIAFMAALISLITSTAFAREISLKDSGTALWLFLAVGTMIVLLQLIPAALLFFGFIGTTTATLFKRAKGKKDAVALEVVEPLTAKK